MEDKEVFVGEIVWFCPKKGFGFISWEKDGIRQKDCFVHWSDICCEGFKTIYKQDRVQFSIGQNLRGDPKAVDVTVFK